jgi:CubicO group peptidase (beta-lactamase class C family)
MNLRSKPALLILILPLLCLLSAPFFPASAAAGTNPPSAVYKQIEADKFMTRWLTLGPIPVFSGAQRERDEDMQKAVFDERQLDSHRFGALRDRTEQIIGTVKYEWRFTETASDEIDFSEIYGDSSFAIAFAWAELHSPEERRMLFGFGSDDAIKVWLNGELVHDNWIARPVRDDDDLFPLTLKKGKNELLVKVQNRDQDWGFSCRVIGPDLFPDKLVASARRGNIDALELLIENGADVNAVSGPGVTAYHMALIRGRTDIAAMLIERGADTTIAMPPRDELVTALFNDRIQGVTAGAAALIAREGEIVYHRGFGYANVGNEVPVQPETKFRIGSITKQFTAAAILKLQEAGLLSVTDPLSTYVPGIPRGDEVTIHHLLTHTSGIHSYTSESDFLEKVTLEVSTDSLIATIKGFEYDFDPGEEWRYNNSGYYLLGCIIEKVAGQPYGEYMQRTFFDPIGMDDTGVHHVTEILTNEATGYSYINGSLEKALDWNMSWAGGAGNLYSTVGDLYRWNQAIFNGWALDDASLAAAHTPVTLNDGTTDTPLGGGYGYGLVIGELRGLKEISHGGGLHGFVSHLARYPEKHVTICVLSNCAPAHRLAPGQLAVDIAEIYLWEDMAPVESFARDTSVDPALYDDYAGRYEFPMGDAIMRITREGDKLFAQLSGQPKYEIFPRSETEFFWKVVEASITFVRDEQGAVTHAVHHQFGREFEAPRLEEEREIQIDPALYEAYAGRYQLMPKMILTITTENGRIFSQATGQPRAEIFPKSETEFFLKIVQAEITFVKDEVGKVKALILDQGGRSFTAPRLD